jgi:UDP-N-acetylmuramate-alanine ligase
MKTPGKLTVTALIGAVILGVGLLPAWGQGGNPPASTKESGATSGHGYTLVEQTFNVEDQVRTLHDQSRQAALNADANFLEKHLANTYLGIGDDGRLRTKAETIQEFKSGAIKYESLDEHDVKVNTYGNAAVVNSMASVKLTADGKPISGDFRTTSVYVKQGGNWKEVSFQATPVAPEGS